MSGFLVMDVFTCVGLPSYRRLLMRGVIILTKRTLALQLCQVDTSMHVNELAKYYKTLDGTTTLVMTPAAMQRGLLEPAIVGIVILSSGQNID